MYLNQNIDEQESCCCTSFGVHIVPKFNSTIISSQLDIEELKENVKDVKDFPSLNGRFVRNWPREGEVGYSRCADAKRKDPSLLAVMTMTPIQANKFDTR